MLGRCWLAHVFVGNIDGKTMVVHFEGGAVVLTFIHLALVCNSYFITKKHQRYRP